MWHRIAAALIAVGCALAVSLAGSAALGRGRPDPGVGLVGERHYRVESGDTVWSIARRLSPGRDPRPVVQAILDANALDEGRLLAGQDLLLP